MNTHDHTSTHLQLTGCVVSKGSHTLCALCQRKGQQGVPCNTGTGDLHTDQTARNDCMQLARIKAIRTTVTPATH
jgi:hypothetical protein